MFARWMFSVGIVLIIGFLLTIKGNPSYWQIIGLLLMVASLVLATMAQLSTSEKASSHRVPSK
ncbi:hypothetical protein GCM10025857_31430 [Alicyclobacillus contaminans]|uniref:hypothetical protein n=1 Tax=Alicyclobacillus contaminans TaxID=392016 RepID=UPI0004133A7B|nr:hypothetical protein [Alicyclobacillus contaminans]GMA51786.1 hypothetical protein GCM10025857_31430 [Alicyclobacillus contaminans]